MEIFVLLYYWCPGLFARRRDSLLSLSRGAVFRDYYCVLPQDAVKHFAMVLLLLTNYVACNEVQFVGLCLGL
jgi:hypothetical protein